MLRLYKKKCDNMPITKFIFHLLILFVLSMPLLANQSGYYILKFHINENDVITLRQTTYVNSQLKQAKEKTTTMFKSGTTVFRSKYKVKHAAQRKMRIATLNPISGLGNRCIHQRNGAQT